ncbi:hypothetical protein A6302_04098 [Methylobrevis pamukkalensis]|uniref:Uncharacterized protein n=1 Tax=Methylobrevis pamukkalensis TaxID=1439726 RepID=A0A1E3GX28_9HYPH|nr:hypothetical protein A6302_04098 [Methylobrevis pamukkalensis]
MFSIDRATSSMPAETEVVSLLSVLTLPLDHAIRQISSLRPTDVSTAWPKLVAEWAIRRVISASIAAALARLAVAAARAASRSARPFEV